MTRQTARRRHRVAEDYQPVLVPSSVVNALLPHASRRSIPANELVRRLLEAVAYDDMVDAVLDDTETFR